MPDTFDLESRFDDLVRDVSRAVGPGDVTRPVRLSHRRRVAAGAVALVLATTVGVTVDALVRGDPDTSSDDAASTVLEPSPGAERRARLLSMLPSDGRQVGVVDILGFSGGTGLDFDDAEGRTLGDYVLAGVATLRIGPLPRLLFPDLVTYVGTGTTDLYLVDRPAEEVVDGLERAGWQDDRGVLVPSASVRRITASLARHVQVTGEGEQALVVVGRTRGDIVDPDSPPQEPGPLAGRLLDLGGAVGFAIDFSDGCAPEAVSLVSPVEGTVLIGPPPGVDPPDVTVEDLEVPDGFTSIEAVSPLGDLVRARVTVPGPEGPIQLLSRLGLPGTSFC